ncbi:MAG: AbrB/MazE/SpoVT family DNA-binding domain-containing protein [Methermicoccaceae archaeon]
MGTVTKIYRQANCLALIIPAEIVKKFSLKKGQYVVWELRGDEIIIKPLSVVEEEEGEEEVKKDV